MYPKPIFLACATSLTIISAAPATAVGDMPIILNQRQASITFARVRALLRAENLTCPVGQAVESGTVTGGSSPNGGSQTTTIMFNKGGKVVISRSWESNNGPSPALSIMIDCTTK